MQGLHARRGAWYSRRLSMCLLFGSRRRLMVDVEDGMSALIRCCLIDMQVDAGN
jgi:hypothetical protein